MKTKAADLVSFLAVPLTILLMAALSLSGCEKGESGDSAGSQVRQENGGNGSSEDLPVIIELTQPGCPPCGTARTLVKGLVDKMGGRVRFEEIDVTKDRDAAKKYRVQATPTLVILDRQGNQTWSYVGVPSEKELAEEIERVISS